MDNTKTYTLSNGRKVFPIYTGNDNCDGCVADTNTLLCDMLNEILPQTCQNIIWRELVSEVGVDGTTSVQVPEAKAEQAKAEQPSTAEITFSNYSRLAQAWVNAGKNLRDLEYMTVREFVLEASQLGIEIYANQT